MTSSAFRLVPYSLHFHSATVNYSSQENEGFFNKSLFVTVTKMNLHFFLFHPWYTVTLPAFIATHNSMSFACFYITKQISLHAMNIKTLTYCIMYLTMPSNGGFH